MSAGLTPNQSQKVIAEPANFNDDGKDKGSYYTEERGRMHSTTYRMYFRDETGQYISPWHDIPLRPAGVDNLKIFNMLVEIPRWSNAKLEVCTVEPLNPIFHDIKNEKLRYIANFFPYHGYPWNYGAIPQTWENSDIQDRFTKCRGDNDMIDCCEIGSKIKTRGTILQVKVLGCFGMIDQGETDYKIIAIDITDPMAEAFNDIQDLQVQMPHMLQRTMEWLRFYKVPEGKAQNQFAFDGAPQCASIAVSIIEDTHAAWEKLSRKDHRSDKLQVMALDLQRTSNPESNYFINAESCRMIVNANPPFGPPEVKDPKHDECLYIPILDPSSGKAGCGCCTIC